MIKFADRMDGMQASDIGDILKVTVRPEIISFAGGLPAPELFPVEDIKTAFNAVMAEAGTTALQYGQAEGWYHLREQIADRMEKRNGIKTDAEHVLITAGSQQGLDFCGKLFLNPGDVVLMESPSYLGAIDAFKAYQPNFVEVPTDDDGIIPEALDKILATTENVKLIYVIPDFQNPSGRTWPMQRRRDFMEVVNKYEVPVIEDNPYGELRFKGEFLPALKSMDTKGLILYFSTFSKILTPGFRLAWICANEAIMKKLVLITTAAVLQTSTLNMMVVSKYLDMFDVDKHVAEIRPVYKHRCELMINTMKETFPEEAKFTDPDGGLFTWVELPERINTKELAIKALDQLVAFVPGAGFFPNGGNTHCLRLNYSNSTDERLVEGVHRLAKVIKEAL